MLVSHIALTQQLEDHVLDHHQHQTINLEVDGITLYDCPGLVFQLSQQNRAAMLCNGVLNIDQMTEHIGPATVISERLPAKAFNILYGTKFTTPNIGATTLLDDIAKVNGLTSSLGM